MDNDVMEFEANFSVLERYGTDVTKEEFITNPAIGRDEQIKELILILLTPEKSAILIGKPGIGKTAIVEGLAYRLQNDDVPEALKGYSIVNIKTASLLGTMPSGESKVQKMIDELKTKDKLILFIDEIHMLIGATDSSALDFANIFKEGLGRGSIKVIGATTTEEYERYILRDKAFTRRFQKVEVTEPTHEETIKIMMGTLPKFEKQTGRKMKYTPFIQERIMDFLVGITSEYKRVFSLGSRYPDVCLTLLKQAFSYTVYDNRPNVDIFDIRKAIENSKNIYPDVIKKELPRFDEIFNDIILEEKGEKPVEEWRKDGTKTRSEIESEENEDEEETIEEDEPVQEEKEKKPSNEEKEVVAESPEQLQKMTSVKSNIISAPKKKPRKDPIFTVPTDGGKFMELGATNFAYGRKSKLNRVGESKGIDDIILGSDVETMKVQKDRSRNQQRYVVSQEVMPGVSDSQLFGSPIESTLNMQRRQPNQQQDARYRVANVRRGQQPPMPGYGPYGPQDNYGPQQGYPQQGGYPPQYQGQGPYGPQGGYPQQGGYPPQYQGQGPYDNRNRRPDRMSINDQNFDRYNNYFHPDEQYNNQGRNNGPMPGDGRDAVRNVVNNNRQNPSKVKGMVSLSDSDSDTLFGYLNKNEDNNKSSNQYDNSIASDTSSYQQSRSENTDRQPRQNNNSNRQPNRGSSGTDGIRSLIESNESRTDEDASAGLDEFPMLNIMKSLSSEEQQEEVVNDSKERPNNSNKKQKEEKLDASDLDSLSNDDLLGGLGTINESGSIEFQVEKKEDKKEEEKEEPTDDLINFSSLNNSAKKEEKVEDRIEDKVADDFKLDNKESDNQIDEFKVDDLNKPIEVKEEDNTASSVEDFKKEVTNIPEDLPPLPKYDLNLEDGSGDSEDVFDDFFG